MAQIIDKVVVSDRLAEVGEGLFIYPSFDLENAEIFQYYYTPPPPVLYYYDDFSTYSTGSYIFVCNGGVWDESLFYFTSNAVARDFITCESLDTGSLNGQYVRNWTSGSIFVVPMLVLASEYDNMSFHVSGSSITGSSPSSWISSSNYTGVSSSRFGR